MMDDRHRALKRWERARQFATLSREMEEVGPAAACRVRDPQGGTQTVSVFILEIFSKDLVCVKSTRETPLAIAPALYWLVGIAITGVVISMWYYFGIIRVMYWSAPAAETASIRVPGSLRVVLLVCILGMLLLGILPEPMMKITRYAAGVFGKPAVAGQTALTAPAPLAH